jgi:photosystem II stability/assembly factor-like uncharacterized protein
MKKALTLLVLALISSATVAQWSEQTSGVTTVLSSVSAVDNNNVWICGLYGKILRTTNGGVNWQLSVPNSTVDLYNVWAVDSNTALVAGKSVYINETIVYKTTNGGANWTTVFGQGSGFINYIGELSLTNPNNLFMCGDPVGGRWSLWKSTNAGSTWDSTGWYLPGSETSEMGYNNSGFIYRRTENRSIIWFGTDNTRIFRWNFWQGWISQPTTGQQYIVSILFIDTLNGIAGCRTGMLYTSNGGNNWVNATSIPGSGETTGLVALNNGEMFYCRGSSIYRTTNSGLNWVISTSQSGIYSHMSYARTQGNFNIWAVRSYGGISKYTYPIGIKPLGNEVPNSFLLYQNYPNPFNPSTKIKFSIPPSKGARGMNVRLVVYDVLGREVAALIPPLGGGQEGLKPGTYEVEWDASNYTSGVYFYKLTTEASSPLANPLSITKKMVLLK